MGELSTSYAGHAYHTVGSIHAVPCTPYGTPIVGHDVPKYAAAFKTFIAKSRIELRKKKSAVLGVLAKEIKIPTESIFLVAIGV